MLHISSRDNPLYKFLKRVSQGRADHPMLSDTEGRETNVMPVLLEGIHLCEEWLRHRGQPERAIFDLAKLERSPQLQRLAQDVDSQRMAGMDSALIKSISPIAQAQGVCFYASQAPATLPVQIEHDCIWLDSIQDPGNVGTLLRTAAAAGIKHAYLSQGCAAAWSTRVLRSAQGAHFVMHLYEQANLMHLCERLAIPLVATAMNSTASSIYDTELANTCAWVFGNEGRGVDPVIQATATRCVYVPQEPDMESLNVAVAAGVCLFEQRRQRKGRV